MSCVRFKFDDGTNGILTLSDESEPFMYGGKRFIVSKQWGPAQVNRRGDLLSIQPSGRMLQGAYEHWKRVKAGP